MVTSHSKVAVLVYGVGSPSEGLTDEDGQVELPLYSLQPARPRRSSPSPARIIGTSSSERGAAFGRAESRSLRSFSETLPRYNARPYLSWDRNHDADPVNGAIDGQESRSPSSTRAVITPSVAAAYHLGSRPH